MKSLFEIKSEYLAIIRQAEEAEGILTPELDAALKINEAEKSIKSENYIHYIKTLESEIQRGEDAKAHAEAYIKERKSMIEKLKNNLLDAVNTFGPIKAGLFELKTRKSESIEIIGDVPSEYINLKITETPDKAKLKAAIKEGKEVEGAILVQNINLAIK